MPEQSLRLLYLSVAAFLFVMAMQSFYHQEKAFQSFFSARRAATESVSWWQEGVKPETTLVGCSTGTIDFGHEKRGTLYNGKELKQQLVGLAIGLSREYQPREAMTYEMTLEELPFSDNLIRKGVAIVIEGLYVTDENVAALCESIDPAAYYAFSYDEATKVYVIDKTAF